MAHKKVEILKNGKWLPIPFRRLVKGDTVKFFMNNDCHPITDKDGNYEFICACSAFLDSKRKLKINTVPNTIENRNMYCKDFEN